MMSLAGLVRRSLLWKGAQRRGVVFKSGSWWGGVPPIAVISKAVCVLEIYNTDVRLFCAIFVGLARRCRSREKNSATVYDFSS